MNENNDGDVYFVEIVAIFLKISCNFRNRMNYWYSLLVFNSFIHSFISSGGGLLAAHREAGGAEGLGEVEVARGHRRIGRVRGGEEGQPPAAFIFPTATVCAECPLGTKWKTGSNGLFFKWFPAILGA